jgi:hypothetical protein
VYTQDEDSSRCRGRVNGVEWRGWFLFCYESLFRMVSKIQLGDIVCSSLR